MKKIILLFSISISFSFILENPVLINDSKRMDGNNIGSWFFNNGIYNSNPVTNNSGFEWPIGTNKFARYKSGIWMIAKSGNDTVAAIAYFSTEFLPGYIDQNGNPQGKDDPDYRIYKIVEGDTVSEDYLNWPSSQGAYTNQEGKPLLLGNQTMFFSFTDGYPESHYSPPGNTSPMKAQILQTNWCYNNTPELSNIIFTEYRIINKGNKAWNDAYISIWNDESVDGYSRLGCDTLHSLIYKYITNNNEYYESPRPVVGSRLLKGPINFTGNNSDTAIFCDLKNMVIRKKAGYKETKFSSYNFSQNSNLINGTPNNYRQTYLYVQGIKKTGEPWVNPLNNQITKYPYSGDPYTGAGMINHIPGNTRQILNSGPINILPNDTQYITFVQVIAQGENDMHSIQLLREYSDIAQEFYNNCFTQIPVGINQVSAVIPDGFSLSQNYPNPFNPATNIKFSIPTTQYTVLKVFDITGREVATLVNEQLEPGEYNYQFSMDNYQLSSGVYFYRLIASDKSGKINFLQTKKMVLVK